MDEWEGLDFKLGAVNFEMTTGPLSGAHEWAIRCSSLESREICWDSHGSH